MTYDAKELEQYPEIMNKEQLRKVCHISKRTAHYLLLFNLIPHVCTGKKTRCYAIRKKGRHRFYDQPGGQPQPVHRTHQLV